MTTHSMTFMIDIPTDKVDLAVKALDLIGVEFTPKEQIALINSDSDIDYLAVAGDLNNILDIINKALEEQKSGYQLLNDTNVMNLAQIHSILEIGHYNIVWNGSKVLETNWNWDDSNMECIDVILMGYPELQSLFIKTNRRSKSNA